MKSFVIKENGLYSRNKNDFVKHLFGAKIFLSKEDAENYKKDMPDNENCEVIEITIKEGDLEQQLAEKDKEIEELKRDLQLEYAFTPVRGDGKTFTKLNVIQDFKNSIRKQVCDEIREYIAKDYSVSVEDMLKSYHFLSWSVKEIYELLDQIEQGE